ncbi:MAG: hypothetical protein C4324_01530 [Blastocatellia bacterium]
MSKTINPLDRFHRAFIAVTVAAIVCGAFSIVFSQTVTEELKRQAQELVNQKKFLEALPLLEKIAAAEPQNAAVQFDLGNALLVKSVTSVPAEERRSFRLRARAAFVKSQELGNDTLLVRAFISSIPADGSDGEGTSKNPASSAMVAAGEEEFAKNNYQKAIDYYQKALEFDSKNYYAALFIGDSYLQMNDFDKAETWYQKAIVIDPNLETAYRYSATPLMRQKKYDLALQRYIEAWITEPYNRFALNGLLQWGAVTGTKLAHPEITPPKIEIGPDGNSKTTVNVNPLSDDGSMAWIAYVNTRQAWKNELFSKKFPKESEYRHTLAEEVEALRAVVKMAESFKPKKLNHQIEMIKRLDSEGLLEAYILLASPDKGIAEDYEAYLQSNRAKLREYVNKYVVQKQN